MKAALEQAGVDTDRARLYTFATDSLRAAGRAPTKALDRFVASITAEGGLCAALMPEPAIKAEALRFLIEVAKDMDGEGQQNCDAQSDRAPAGHERGGGHCRPEAQPVAAPAPPSNSDPGASREEAGGQRFGAAQGQTAPEPPATRERAGHVELDAQAQNARPSREPTPAQRKANRKAAAKLHADFKIGALGVAFGDVRVGPMLDRLIFTAGREKVLGRVAKAYVARQAHLPGKDAKLREIIDDATMGRMIAFAKHSSLHGIEYMNDGALLEQMETFDA